MHEVLRLGQHRSAMPLKPHDAVAVHPCRGRGYRSRKRILQFQSHAGDGAELYRLSSEEIEGAEPVGRIDLEDDLTERAVQVATPNPDRGLLGQQFNTVERDDLLQLDCRQGELALELAAVEGEPSALR